MSLPVKSCYPGDLVTCPEALETWHNEVETRLAAFEARQPTPVPGGDSGRPGSLCEQMRYAAVGVAGRNPKDWGPHYAAIIRVVAAYIERWACSDLIDTEQLMCALEVQAKIAERK